MPVELVGDTGINALKRRLRTLYQQEHADAWEIEQAARELRKMGWKVTVGRVILAGKKHRIVFEQITTQEGSKS